MATEYIAVTGATTAVLKLNVYFEELASTGPVIVEVGTNKSWSSGVEVKMIKESIKRDYSMYADWDGDIFIYEATQTHPTVAVHPLWDEYVVNPATYRKIHIVARKTAKRSVLVAVASSGVSCDTEWTFTVKIQDTGMWEFIKLPNPVLAGREDARCDFLKSWIVTQLCLLNGVELQNSMRIFRNSGGFAKGEPLKVDDIVWKNLWYVCIVDPAVDPLLEDPSSPESLIGGWNDITTLPEYESSVDGIDGPQ